MAGESWGALSAFAPLFANTARETWSPDDSLSASETAAPESVFGHYAKAGVATDGSVIDHALVSPSMLVDHLSEQAAAVLSPDVPRSRSKSTRRMVRELESRLDALAHSIHAIMALAAEGRAIAAGPCDAMPSRSAVEAACAPVFAENHTPPESHMRAVVQALIAATPGCGMAAGRVLLSDVRCWFRKRREAAGVRLQNHVRRSGGDPRALLSALDAGRADVRGLARGAKVPQWREDVLRAFVRQKLASMCQRGR